MPVPGRHQQPCSCSVWQFDTGTAHHNSGGYALHLCQSQWWPRGDKGSEEKVIRIDSPHFSLSHTHTHSLEELFYRYGVDVILEAHEHSYERLWPVYNEQVTAKNYINPEAPIHIISAAAGCNDVLETCIDPMLGPRGEWNIYFIFFYALISTFRVSQYIIIPYSWKLCGDFYLVSWWIFKKLILPNMRACA